MRQGILGIFFLFLLISNPLSLQAGWLERKAEGWAWYEDSEKQKKNLPSPLVLSSPLDSTPILTEKEASLSAAEQAAQIKKGLEEKLAQAVLYPTEENISLYMQEQQKWVEQSALFSKLWAKILLQKPHLDTTLEFPVSQYGIQLVKQLQQEERVRLMQRLSQEYGLFFFYEGQSQISQTFALVVQEFAHKYNWQILAISKDGILLEGFSHNYLDNGTIQKLNVEIFPSLFLVNPSTEDVRPISFGLSSVDRIESNIELQFSQEKEK